MSIPKLLSLTLVVLVAVALVGCNKGPRTSGGDPANTAGAVVNSKCPLMGGKVDPAKVSSDLVVDFDGKKVGFCCAMCAPKWAKLSDEEKKTALAKVTP